MRKWCYEVRKDDSAAIKGVAIMLMLVHHLFAFPTRLLPGVSFESFITLSNGTPAVVYFAVFSKICVAMFTLLAGYGIYRSFAKQLQMDRSGDHTQTYIAFFARRLKKLYFKVWPVFLVFVPLGLAIKSPYIAKDAAAWIKNALLIDTTFNAEWWFLTTYVILVLLSPMMMSFFSRKRSSLYSDALIIVIVEIFIERVLLNYVVLTDAMVFLRSSLVWAKLSTTLILLPIFFAGAWLAKYDIYERILNSFRGKDVKRVVLGVVITALVVLLRGGWVQMNSWGFDQFDIFYSVFITLGILMVICRLRPLKKILAFIGNQSTGMWLTHSFFCFYYFQKFAYAPKYAVLIFLLVFAMSLASAWVVDFCANFITKKLSSKN